MMHLFRLFLLVFLSQLACSADTTSQIGINIVSIFGRPLDEQYQTKWIGVHGEGITTQDTFTQTYTETVESRPVIRTTPVRIAVATATAAADGYQPGDISIVFSDQLVGELEDLANVACAGGAKLKTRQACSASGAGRFVEGAAGPGGLMEDVFLNGFPKITIPAGDVANALQKMIAAGKILAAYESVAAVAALWLSIKLELGPKQIIQVHKNDVSSASTTKPPSPITSSSTACPTGANAPLCARQDTCKGVENVCSNGKYKKCKCIDEFDIIPHPVAEGQLKAQQAFLASVAALPAPTKTQEAWCVWMANPRASPTAWCECDKGKSTFGVATATASTAGVCPYSTAPGETITVSTKKHGGATTSSSSTSTSSSMTVGDSQPTVSPGKPFCYGNPAPLGDMSKMNDGIEKFCKGIKKDMIQTGFSTGPSCSVKLPKDVWMELSVGASYHDLNGQCPQANMNDLNTSYDQCKEAMTNALDCESPTTIYNGDRPETQGGTDILDCVLYVVQTVKETKAKAC